MKLLYYHNTDISQHTANLTQVISMCKAFAKNRINVFLALPIPSKENHSKKEKIEKRYGINGEFQIILFVNPIRIKKLMKYTNHFFAKSLIEKIDPDICYTRDVNFAKITLSKKITTIYESHNYLLHIGNQFINKWMTNKLHASIKHPDFKFMVTISESLKQYWVARGIPQNKIISLHDGFLEEKYRNAISIEEARNTLNLPVSKKIAVYTGNLFPNRGVELILKLAIAFPEVLFLVIGGPQKYRQSLEVSVKDQNIHNIVFKGYVKFSDIHLYHFAANVNLGIWSNKVPTINYCSPLKVFEYMAAGRPIVAMGFPPIKEVLIDGVNSFVTDPNDIEDFKRKLGLALEKGSEKIGINARNEAFNHYSWSQRVQIIIENI